MSHGFYSTRRPDVAFTTKKAEEPSDEWKRTFEIGANQRIEELKQENAELRKRIAELEAQLVEAKGQQK